MAADDRKKKILDHVNLSAGGIKYTSSTPENTPTLPKLEKTFTPPPSLPKVENRKKRIMDHLNSSSDDFKSLVNDSDNQKKQQIQAHLKKSLG
jgi:hypothetical protein